MSTHKVQVSVEGRTIRVTPDPVVIQSADELHWNCSTPHRFRVEFDGQGPFANRTLGHDSATQPQRPRGSGRFKYTVSLESDPSIQLDPEVIVEQPPSHPGP
jgi:hypothetical protein